jgi:DnaJ-domain-containing protein 1
MSAECLDRCFQRARNFAIDALTAEVASAFAGEGIGTVVLKGPVLARWLYPGEVRPYIDSDLMVAPENRARAVSVLERLGFTEYCPWMPTPLSLDPGGTAFSRDGVMVDLHCQLPGLDGDPDAIWDRLAASADRQVIAGVESRVPDRDTVLLHVVLHAAHHANLADGKPLEDLRRALARVEQSRWSCALELARTYGGVPAFAAGLRLLPEGRDLARRLNLGEVRSLRHKIRREDNVIAEELYALLSADAGIRRKLAIAASDLFPRPDYMRWWSPLARRGKLGLAGAYVWRAIWVTGQAPRAIHTLWRIQRAKDRE